MARLSAEWELRQRDAEIGTREILDCATSLRLLQWVLPRTVRKPDKTTVEERARAARQVRDT